MPNDELDPTASTDRFRAFVEEESAPTSTANRRSATRIIVPLLVAVAIIAVAVWLLL